MSLAGPNLGTNCPALIHLTSCLSSSAPGLLHPNFSHQKLRHLIGQFVGWKIADWLRRVVTNADSHGQCNYAWVSLAKAWSAPLMMWQWKPLVPTFLAIT